MPSFRFMALRVGFDGQADAVKPQPSVKSFLEFWPSIESRAIYHMGLSCHNPCRSVWGRFPHWHHSLTTFRLNSPADSLVFPKKGVFPEES